MKRVLVAALMLVAIPASAKTVRYAIAIGVNTPLGATDLPTLRFADDDAVRFAEHFRQSGAETALLALLDADTQKRYPQAAALAHAPTWPELASVVARYAQSMTADRGRGDDPIFFLSYSGHGAGDEAGTYYLTLSDGELTQARLYAEIIDRLPARYHHLFVDACHAEAIVGSRGRFDKEHRAATVDVAQLQSPLAQHPSVGVLLAAAADEEAHEWSRLSAGVFTHEILSALAGAADVNGDGRVEYSEVSAFVAAANRSVADSRAALTIRANAPLSDHHAVLADLSTLRDTAWLVGDFSTLGHFFIELANGERYLDAHVADAQPLRIALPAHTSVFIRTPTLEAELLSPAAGERVALASLHFTHPLIASRGSLDAAYRAALFASAFGVTYYQGFVDSSGTDSVRFLESPQQAPRRAPRQIAAIAAWAVSGAGVLTGSVGLGVMLAAKHDFDESSLENAARSANARYEAGRAVAIAGGATAIAFGVVGALLWPHAPLQLAMTTEARRASFAFAGIF